jgi:phosphoribosyl-ATP pyrophosphohydrolase
MTSSHSLGAALDTLCATVEDRARSGDPSASYTAKLLSQGVEKCAKKLGEEGVETALAAMAGPPEHVAEEAADLLYHLAVLLRVAGVPPEDVAAVLDSRSRS